MRAAASPEELPDLNVSRETSERIGIFENLLRRWSRRINLVSRGSLDDFERRHLMDSHQLLSLAPPGAKHWADLGSGGGFPGLVVAIIMVDSAPDMRMTLIESDRRKAAFLVTAAQAVGIAANVQVIAERIERTPPLDAEVVSARALAPLDRLLGLAERHLSSTGTCLFPKGLMHAKEVAEARQSWQFECNSIPSLTEPGAAILRIPAPIQRL
jgi:16S rRNA (guanine527-N7)-methyltransferase